MDNQPSQSDRLKKAHLSQQVDSITTGDKEFSRFSRRKFLQTSAVATPLLMSVKSPMAWGCTAPTNGSVTSQVSGNVSNAVTSNCSCAKDPAAWLQIFRQSGSYSRWDEWWKHRDNPDGESYKQALEICGVTSSTSFNSLFLNNHFEWRRCQDYSSWEYRILSEKCDAPSVGQALEQSSCQIVLRVQKATSRHPYDSYYGSYSQSDKESYDVTISDENLHKFLTCGYLNSLLAPDIIAYEYYPRDIENAINQAIVLITRKVIERKNDLSSSITTPFTDLRDNLEKSWRLV